MHVGTWSSAVWKGWSGEYGPLGGGEYGQGYLTGAWSSAVWKTKHGQGNMDPLVVVHIPHATGPY